MTMNTLREHYKNLWVKEGINKSNEHFEHYFERSMKIPLLVIDNTAHFCFIFPGEKEDYQINCKGVLA